MQTQGPLVQMRRNPQTSDSARLVPLCRLDDTLDPPREAVSYRPFQITGSPLISRRRPSQFTIMSTTKNSCYQTFVELDPSYSFGNSSSNKDLYEMIDRRAKEILDADICGEYKTAVNKGKQQGSLRDYDARDIELRMQTKPWKQVNKIIKENESRNNATSASANPS